MRYLKVSRIPTYFLLAAVFISLNLTAGSNRWHHTFRHSRSILPSSSWIREERPEVKTIFAGELENGARIVYFAADIDRCFGRCALPDHGKLLSNAVKWAAKGTLPIKVEGPGYIDCQIYKQDSRIIVHLVNLSGCNRFGYCDEYYPVGPINVTINSRDINISRAILTVSDGTIPVSSVNGSTVFQIDRIADHEMIILE